MEKDRQKKAKIVLASASPRRRELLRLHYDLVVRPAHANEHPRPGESALAYVRRMAKSKWQDVAWRLRGKERLCTLLSADTVVVFRKRILGKPNHEREAERMLRILSGKVHQVFTAVCLGAADGKEPRKIWVTRSKVQFRSLSEGELQSYLRSGEWKDKAGAYAIQGRALSFVARLEGSITNIVGLPLEDVLRNL